MREKTPAPLPTISSLCRPLAAAENFPVTLMHFTSDFAPGPVRRPELLSARGKPLLEKVLQKAED